MGSRRRRRAGAAGATGSAKEPAAGNPRPLILLGSVLAGTVLVSGAGTLHAEATGVDEPATAPTTAQVGSVAGTDVVTDVESLGDGPHGARLVRLLTAAGHEAYVIADATGTVRSVRVVAASGV